MTEQRVSRTSNSRPASHGVPHTQKPEMIHNRPHRRLPAILGATAILAAGLGLMACSGGSSAADEPAPQVTTSERQAEELRVAEAAEREAEEAEREAEEREADEAEREAEEREADETQREAEEREAEEAEREAEDREAEERERELDEREREIEAAEAAEAERQATTTTAPPPPPPPPAEVEETDDSNLIPPGVIEDGQWFGYLTDVEGMWQLTFDRVDIRDGYWHNDNERLRTLPTDPAAWRFSERYAGQPVEIWVKNQRVNGVYLAEENLPLDPAHAEYYEECGC